MNELQKLQTIAEVRAALATGEVRAAREGAGLSQSEFAGAIGASRAALSAWERAQRRPRAAAALRIGALLGALADRRRS